MVFKRWIVALFVAAVTVLLLVNIGLLAPGTVDELMEGAGEDASRFWVTPYFHIGSMPVTPAFLLKLVVFLVLLAVFSRSLRFVMRRQILDRLPIDTGQRYAIERITGYVVFLVGLLVGLTVIGVDLSTLAVLGGALGIGIGFGLQNIASNFISGLILLFERPIKVGDRIEVGELNGEVVRIGGRSTWILTNRNVVIIVPNSEFVNNRVINWTGNDRHVRFNIPVGVSYGSDPEGVRACLLAVAAAEPTVLAKPAPDVVFEGLGDSSLNFALRVYTTEGVHRPEMFKSGLYFSIFRTFREHGIEIPFPQRDVHVRSLPR